MNHNDYDMVSCRPTCHSICHMSYVIAYAICAIGLLYTCIPIIDIRIEMMWTPHVVDMFVSVWPVARCVGEHRWNDPRDPPCPHPLAIEHRTVRTDGLQTPQIQVGPYILYTCSYNWTRNKNLARKNIINFYQYEMRWWNVSKVFGLKINCNDHVRCFINGVKALIYSILIHKSWILFRHLACTAVKLLCLWSKPGRRSPK